MGNKAYASYTITDLIDGLQWKGALSGHPDSPKKSWAYYNTSYKKSYIYTGEIWTEMTYDGADAEMWYVVPSATSIKRTLNENGNSYVYSPDKITVSYYKQVGSNSPIEITEGEFGWTNGKDVLPNSTSTEIAAESLQNNKTVYFYYRAASTDSWVLWDWETFETLEDGSKGDQGPAGTVTGNLTFYCATESDTDAPDSSSFANGIVNETVESGTITSSTSGSSVSWYSENKFFGTKDKKGVWDTRLGKNYNKRPSKYSCVWSITLIRSQADQNWYKAHDPLRVSLLTAATMAARVQISNSSDEATTVAKWCKEAGLSIISGGTIVSGSITAEQIDVGSLTVHDEFKTSNQSSIDDIEIGGRNILRGSSTGEGWRYTSFNNEEYEFTQDNNTTNEKYIYCDNLFNLEAEQEYTLSFKVKHNGYVNSFDIYILPKTFPTTGIAYQKFLGGLTTEYKEYKLTFVPDSTATNLKDCQLRIDNNGTTTTGITSTLYIKEIKLEKGNKATDWTPAPEDMASSAELKVTNNAISTKVESSDYNSKMEQLDNAISTKVESSDYESGLTQLADQMVAKVHNKESGDVCSWSMTPGGFNVSAVADGVSGGITVNKNGLTVEGTVKAQKGKIGGYTLENETLYAGDESKFGYVGLDARFQQQNGSLIHPYAIYIGDQIPELSPFRVKKDGECIFSKGRVLGDFNIGPICFQNLSTHFTEQGIRIHKTIDSNYLYVSISAHTTSKPPLCQSNYYNKNSKGIWSLASITNCSISDWSENRGYYYLLTQKSTGVLVGCSVVYTTKNTKFTLAEVQKDGFIYDLSNTEKWARKTPSNASLDDVELYPGGVAFFVNNNNEILQIWYFPLGIDAYGDSKDNLFTVLPSNKYNSVSINCSNQDFYLNGADDETVGFYLGKNYLFMSGSTDGTSINVKGNIKCNQVNTNGIRLQSTKGSSSITYDGTYVNIDKIKSTSIVNASGYDLFWHKYYLYTYTNSIFIADTEIAISSATHGLSTVKGAIVTTRHTTGDGGLGNSDHNASWSVRLNGATVYVGLDAGRAEHGFYCLILGR